MDADSFIDALWKCAPEVGDLMAMGLSREEAERFQMRNRAEIKGARSEGRDNVILDLIARYDVVNLEIGMVRFSSAADGSDGWWKIGEAEADPLVVNKSTHEVEVRDLADKLKADKRSFERFPAPKMSQSSQSQPSTGN